MWARPTLKPPDPFYFKGLGGKVPVEHWHLCLPTLKSRQVKAYGKISQLGPISRKPIVRQLLSAFKYALKQEQASHLVFVLKLCLGYTEKGIALVRSAPKPWWFPSLTTMGSPETTREAFLTQQNRYRGYMQFQEYVKLLPQHKKMTHAGDYSFLEWFIGFTEGDGCFGIKNERPYFAINQADLRLMLKLRSKLGFGVVTTFTQKGRTYARFAVYSREGVQRLVHLFNGNIHLEKVHTRFLRWVAWYNWRYRGSVMVKPRLAPSLISLQNAWISGFFDAEGCCYAGLSKDLRMGQGVRLHIKACVDQKLEYDILQQLCALFKVAKVTIRNNEKHYYRAEFVSKQSLSLILAYLTQYKLQGRKNQCYACWSKLSNRFIKKMHLNTEVHELQRQVNKIQSFNQAFKREKSVLILFKQELEKDLLF